MIDYKIYFHERKETLTLVTMWMSLENLTLREATHRRPTLSGSIDTRCPEKANPETGSRLVAARAGEVARD